MNQDIDTILKEDKSEGAMTPLGSIVAMPVASRNNCIMTPPLLANTKRTVLVRGDLMALIQPLFAAAVFASFSKVHSASNKTIIERLYTTVSDDAVQLPKQVYR